MNFRNNKISKPTVSLRKVNEGEFVNVRTYWSVRLSTGDVTYELRVNHGAPEDVFAFFAWRDGDAYRLVTSRELRDRVDAIADHEHCGECQNAACQSRNDPDGAQWQVLAPENVPAVVTPPLSAATAFRFPAGFHFPAVCEGCRHVLRLGTDVACRPLTREDAMNRAYAVVGADNWVVEESYQRSIREQLVGYWEAMCLLVEPEVNAFCKGWDQPNPVVETAEVL
jgi:hypothetical protein